MSIPGDASPLLLGGGAQQYKIERSIRLNAPDSVFLSRTPASAGNRKTWSYSFWLKRTNFGAIQSYLFSGPNGSGDSYVFFNTTDTFAIGTFGSGAWTWLLESSAVFRDSSAWYHFVVSIDTTQVAASERAKIYVNGSQITGFSTSTYPSQNFEGQINNNAFQNKIGADAFIRYSSGYLADIHFIDGQALDPTSFAETNITTGQWVPKAYTGTYGTNGFRLAFADNSNNTATTLGKDSSPNGNNWTPNNLSVTAGAGNDSLVDTPTSYGSDTGAGGEVRGNYCTLNALVQNGGSFSNGNLDLTTSVSLFGPYLGTIGISGGKYYWEVTPTANGTQALIGIAKAAVTYTGGVPDANGWQYWGSNGQKYNNGASAAYGATYTTNDVIGVAFDSDNGTLTFYKNGTSQGQAYSGLTSGPYFPVVSDAANSATTTVTTNFGQRPFAYTAPSGFKALCDTNLPAPVVAKPNTAFDVKLYTGNGSTQTISGLGFSPDLVWVKQRDGSEWNILTDAVRGDQKSLFTNATNAEDTGRGISLQSSGFSLDSWVGVNTNAGSYVAWAWDGGSSTVTNTQGSITSQVRANASAGFSIVSYAGSQPSNFTVGHGLSIQPSFVITKARNAADQWGVYYTNNGVNTNWILLNSTAAQGTNNGPLAGGAYMVFSSTTLQIASAAFANGASSMIAYCFAPVAGYSSFGSYTGNGSADGPFVYTGFRPALVIVKMSSSTGNWTILDYQRQGYNVDNDPLFPNLANTEGTTDLLDLTSNGFKVRTTDATFNTNAGTYVYAAWAQNPYQYARAR